MSESDKTGNEGDAVTAQQARWIFFVTGPTACGKTTVAKFIAEKLNLTFLEGDDVSHSHERARFGYTLD
jgi:gluconokinase